MSRGLRIGFRQQPLRIQAAPVKLFVRDVAPVGAVNSASIIQSAAPVSLALAVQAALGAVGGVQTVKFHSGHYMASDTFDGTGGSQNSTDFGLLNNEPAVLGWLGLYSAGTMTSVQGVYDFSKQIADAKLVLAMGKRYSAYPAAQRFHGSQVASTTVTSSWVPAYILSNSAYGAGTNGTQHGYTLASYDGATGYTETAMALWRMPVMIEYANILVALASTPLTATAGPWAGQTYTFNTHPGVEALFYGYESVLDLTNTSTDYSDAAWRSALQYLYRTVRAAWPNTITVSGLNFCKSFPNMAGFVSDLVADATGMGGPDVISVAKEPWSQHLFKGDTSTDGTTWTSGGGHSYVGQLPSIQWMQDPDPAKSVSTQDIYNTAAGLGASHIFWMRNSRGAGVKGDWATDVLPVINANGLSVPRPSSLVPSVRTNAPLGVNLAGFNYSSGSMPFLNFVKQGGQQSGNYNWCGWLTGTGGAASGSTNEQAQVVFDRDQYPMQIPQAGLTSKTVYTILSNRSVAPGASTAYPAGVYRIQFTGSGTVVVSGGDVSGGSVTLSNIVTGKTVSTTVTLSGAGNITYLTITSSNPSSNGDNVRAVSVVQNIYAASYDAGAIFTPAFLAATTPFSSLRFMDWLQTNNEFEGHNATGNTIAAGATGCTFASATQLPNQTAKRTYFNDGTIRTSTVTTTGSVTTLDWSAGGGALPNTITTSRGVLGRSNLYFSSHDDWSKRPLPSNAFYCMNGGIPYEIAIALCNAVGADAEVPVPMAAPDAYLTSLFQLTHAGTGAQIGGSLSAAQNLLPEFSNEVWNSAFTQYEVAGYFGGGQWSAQPPGGGNATWTGQWHGMRTAVMAELAKTVYGADFGRCIPVLGAQASNLGTVQDRLQTSYWTAPIDGYTGPASAHPIKTVAIAPYFGQFTLSAADTTTMLGVAHPLDDFFATMSSQSGTAANGSHAYPSAGTSPGGWMGEALGWASTYQNYLKANYPALHLMVYEVGQQFGAGTSAWNALLVTANRDARMGAAYSLFLNGWAVNVGSTAANIVHIFNDCWAEQSNGFCWGLYESQMQNLAVSPPAKYAAALAYIG